MAFKQGTKSAFLLSCWCTSWKYNPNKTRMPSNTKIYFNNIHLCQAAKLFLLVSKKDKNTFFIKSFTLWHSLADPGISLPQSAPPAPPPSELLADMQAIIENAWWWWWYSEKVLELEPFPCRKLLLQDAPSNSLSVKLFADNYNFTLGTTTTTLSPSIIISTKHCLHVWFPVGA